VANANDLFDELENTFSGVKPKYATAKKILSELSGYPVTCINPKQITAHNQASPRVSESTTNKLRSTDSATHGWMFVGFITAENPTTREQIVNSITPELKRFATTAAVFSQVGPGKWQLDALMGDNVFLKQTLGLAEAFGYSESDIDTYDLPTASESDATDTEVYTIPNDLLVSDEIVDEIFEQLTRQMNVILSGPPGVGKSYVARRIAEEFSGTKEDIERIQFHQSFGYEDFVCGWRPDGDGSFSVEDGVFLDFCSRASEADNCSKRFVMVIDEINRANVSKVLGELMTLLEPEKRHVKEAMTLAYPRSSGDFYVPPNVYIIATMNTADRSLSMVDYALRRRFAFVEMRPVFGEDRFENFLLEAGVESDIVDKISDKMLTLNSEVRADYRNLGPGYEIGHTYFIPKTSADKNLSWYESIIRSQIAPLVREYWFDDRKKADELVDFLLQ
jgi:MoxR-like ATPase